MSLSGWTMIWIFTLVKEVMGNRVELVLSLDVVKSLDLLCWSRKQ